MELKNKNLHLVAFMAGVVSLAIYLRTLSCDFINFDDPTYVIENTAIRSLGKDFWYWSFCTIPLNYWTPLLWISFAIDYHFWGLDPFGYHLTNILLHGINGGLLVVFAHRVFEQSNLVKEKGYSSFLYQAMLLTAGLLFALHPARVESVAWVTERKDVFNGIFTFGFLIFYLHYVKRIGDAALSGAGKYYALSLLSFMLAMLIKPSGFLMPLALLVMDWYPLGRFERKNALVLIKEKIPFMAVGAGIVAVSIVFRMREGGFNSLADFPMVVRAVAAGNSLIEYLLVMVFPVNILPYEILPRAVPIFYIYKALLAVLVLAATVALARRFPAWASSVFFFVITIVPSLHFLTDGYQTVLSPRYTYLPAILPTVLAAAALASAFRRMERAAGKVGAVTAGGLVVGLLVFYGVTTVALIGDWQNSGVFWTKVIEHQPFDKAYYFRGEYLAEQGDYLAAVQDYSTCLDLATPRTLPDIHNVYAFRGLALTGLGYYQDAVADFSAAISRYPHPLYYYHRSVALRGLGRTGDADADLAAAGGQSGPLRWFQ